MIPNLAYVFSYATLSNQLKFLQRDDHDYFQAGITSSRGVYGPFRLSTLNK